MAAIVVDDPGDAAMSDRICAGLDCNVDLTGTHGRRKWCSERCRRRTEYTNVCACGTRVYDGTRNPPETCGECKHEERYGERNRRMLEMWEAGDSAPVIAGRLGMSESAIPTLLHFYRRKKGLLIPMHRLGGGAKERRARHESIIQWRREGVSNADIAERLGTTRESVWTMFAWLRSEGWDVPRLRQRVPLEKIVALRAEGKSNQEIADGAGYADPSAVSHRLSRAGLIKKKPKS